MIDDSQFLPILVSSAGTVVAAIGLIGIAAPNRLIDALSTWRGLTRLPLTAALRIAFGVIFVTASPSCRLPELVFLVGVLELVGAATLLGLGAKRLRLFVEWWLRQSSTFVRSWCVAVVTFGLVLVYAGA